MENKTIQALQNVYKSLGGNISNVLNINNIPDMILAISSLETSSTNNISLLSTALEDTEDSPEILQALMNLYVSYGGDINDVKDITSISDLINSITEAKTIYNSLKFGINEEYSGNEEYGVEVGTFQSDINFFGDTYNTYYDVCIDRDIQFSGSFTQVEGGLTESGLLSGTGYFIALEVFNQWEVDTIEFAVEQSENYSEFVSPDINNFVVLKFDDLKQQNIIVRVRKNNITRYFRLYYWSISGI